MGDIRGLDELTAADEPLSGGKAYNCARLKRAGFRVPDGLVVLASALDDEIDRLGAHAWFECWPNGTRFVVRSSGIGEDSGGQSFAGIHQTRLNVPADGIVEAVRACRASARTPQAFEYRRAMGLPTDGIQIAVLIQQMVDPVSAGVAFSVNPVTGDDQELVINSSWGVGEALVSGQIDPDEFVVRKHDCTLIWSRAGTAADRPSSTSLSADRVIELARIVIDIERHYGSAQDVEWCHDGERFWIVQSRPVTAPARREGDIEWTRANLAEVLPDLTSPQALAALEQMLNEGERRYMGGLLASEATLGPMVRSFCGRLYFNLSQLRRVCAIAGQPAADLLRSFGHGAAIQASDEIVPPVPLRDRLAVVPDFVRLVVRHLRAEWYVRAHATSMQAWMDRFSPDPAMMQDEEIWTAMEAWRADAPSAIETVLMLGGVTFHEAPVQKACKRVGFSYERLVYPQLAAGERSVSAQQAFDLLALAATAGRDPAVVETLSSDPLDIDLLRRRIEGSAFLREFDRFLNAYGHRGRYESDWALPRYAEDPTPLLQAIRSHVQAGTDTDRAATVERQQRESAEAWTAFEQVLSPWQRWFLLPRIRRSVRMAKQYYLWRERVRSEMVRVMSRVRRWHLELANRFVKRGWLERRDDYFLLHLEEIGAAIGGTRDGASLHDTVAVRAAALERHQAIQMPLLMRESDLPRLVRLAGVSSRPGTDAELSGHPVSAGVVEAEVVIVRDPADFGRMKAGAILVARATDPSWTPLFTLASGVIVEIGGVLSHASTIAREYGLPAVANVRNATRLLSTGERVRLDATTGIISRLGRERVFATVA